MKDFFAIQLPHSSEVKFYEAQFYETKEINLNEEYFLVQPFHSESFFSTRYTPISKQRFFSYIQNIQLQDFDPLYETEITQKQFTDYVQETIAKINNNLFSKCVTARYEIVQIPVQIETLMIWFQKIATSYPNSFCALVYSHHFGLWLGASPELFLSGSKNSFQTFALAGTKKNKENFTDKEFREQKIVEQFIAQEIQNQHGEINSISPPIEIHSGHIKHLKTEFQFTIPQMHLQSFITAMHPTPALSGFPQKNALNWIAQVEKNKRKLYGGYWGFCGSDINLFVNIRCMEVFQNYLVLHAGCGINQGSIPEQEWLETEEKIKVLKSIVASES